MRLRPPSGGCTSATACGDPVRSSWCAAGRLPVRPRPSPVCSHLLRCAALRHGSTRVITSTWNTFSAAVLRPSHLPIRRSTGSGFCGRFFKEASICRSLARRRSRWRRQHGGFLLVTGHTATQDVSLLALPIGVVDQLDLNPGFNFSPVRSVPATRARTGAVVLWACPRCRAPHARAGNRGCPR